MTQEIIVFDCTPDIYIYEEDCGYKPNPPYKKYGNLKEAIESNPKSKILRYPSKNLKHDF